MERQLIATAFHGRRRISSVVVSGPHGGGRIIDGDRFKASGRDREAGVLIVDRIVAGS